MTENFAFKDPTWFAALALIASVVALRLFRRQRVLIVPFSARWQSSANRGSREAVATSAVLVGLCLLVIALARPQTRTQRTEFGIEAYDVMLAIDVSRSMLSEDYEVAGRPISRLEVLKPIVENFVLSRPRDRIGITVFSGTAYTLMPPTWNHARLLASFARLNIVRFPPGTAIGDGLALALEDLMSAPATESRRARSRFVVLMSDGSNNAGLFSVDEAVSLAERQGTRVYTIAAGTGAFNSIPYVDEHGERQYELGRGDVDEGKLWMVASATGGKFFRATNTDAIYASFDAISQRQSQNLPLRNIHLSQELFPWFALPGVGFVLLSVGLLRLSAARWAGLVSGLGTTAKIIRHGFFPEMKTELVREHLPDVTRTGKKLFQQ